MSNHIARVDSFVSDIHQIIQEHEAQQTLISEIIRRLEVKPSGESYTPEDILKRVDSVMIRLRLIK